MSRIKYPVAKLLLILSLFLKISFADDIEIEVQDKSNKFILLTIDGGGVRGIIPAMILEEIEKRTKTPIYQMVDAVAGNSTGGIIALGLVVPHKENKSKNLYSAKDLVDLYKNQSKVIFQETLWHKIKTGYNLWGPKYDRTNLDKILQNKFGDATLREALVPTYILSYCLEPGEGRIFSSIMARKKERNDFFMRDIASSTSAAPTYFAPFILSNTQGNFCLKRNEKIIEKCTQIDGGVFANNPTIIAAATVLKKNYDMKREDLVVISLGTGSLEDQHFSDPKNKGMIGWIKDINIIDLILNASEDVSEWVTVAFGIKTYRLQVVLSECESAMDNSSDKNINELILRTQRYIEANSALIDEVCSVLLENNKML